MDKNMTVEEARRGLLYYEQLLLHMAEELNVRAVILDIGMYGDGKHITGVYRYDTAAQKPIGLELQVDGEVRDAPKSLLLLTEKWFDGAKV